MSTTKRITIVTTCDRPRCEVIIREESVASADEVDDADATDPDFLLQRDGMPEIRYRDLCERCTKTIGNYCNSIEKKPQEKPEPGDPPAGDPEAVDPDSDAGPAAGGEEPA